MTDSLESWIGMDFVFNQTVNSIGKVVKEMKKVIALITSILFVLGISVVSFAADTVKPETTATKAVEDKAVAKKKVTEEKAAAGKMTAEDKAAAKEKQQPRSRQQRESSS